MYRVFSTTTGKLLRDGLCDTQHLIDWVEEFTDGKNIRCEFYDLKNSTILTIILRLT